MPEHVCFVHHVLPLLPQTMLPFLTGSLSKAFIDIMLLLKKPLSAQGHII